MGLIAQRDEEGMDATCLRVYDSRGNILLPRACQVEWRFFDVNHCHNLFVLPLCQISLQG